MPTKDFHLVEKNLIFYYYNTQISNEQLKIKLHYEILIFTFKMCKFILKINYADFFSRKELLKNEIINFIST